MWWLSVNFSALGAGAGDDGCWEEEVEEVAEERGVGRPGSVQGGEGDDA